LKPYFLPKKRYCISVIIFLFSISCLSQIPHFRFKNYGEQAGLSQSVVHKILQDKRGYLWLATENGLNRFDGKKFKVYTKQKYPSGLPWSNIRDFAEDSVNGLLWIATAAKGLCVFDYKKEVFRGISKGKIVDENINFINTIDNQIWVASKSGISIADRGSETIIKNFLLNKDIKNVVPVANHNVVAFSSDGTAYIIDQLSFKLTKIIRPEALFKDRKSFSIWNVYEQNGVIWICTTTGLYKIKASLESFGKQLKKEKIRCNNSDFTHGDFFHVLTDRSGNTWIATNGQGVIFKGSTDSIYYQVKKEAINSYSISDNYVWQIYQDRTDNMWFATEKNLNRILPKPPFIETVGQEIDSKTNLLNRLFAVGTNDDKTIILGRLDDIAIYNLQTGITDTVSNKTGSLLGRSYIIYPWKKDQFLVGSKYGLKLLERKKDKYFVRTLNEHDELRTLDFFRITSIALVDSNNILLGGIGGTGLIWWDMKNHQLINYKHSDNSNSLVNNNINKIYRSGKGDFWIGTDEGLSKFNAKTKEFTNFFYKDETHEAHYINDIIEFNDDLWLTFYQEGLAKWNMKSEPRVYNEQYGLTSKVIFNLKSDNKNLWLSSSKGLFAFDPKNEIFVNYTSEDGIQDNEFNRFCVFETNDCIYFGGISGLNIIYKNNISLFKSYPAVAIEEISYLQGDHYEFYKDFYKGYARLKHFQNNIVFDFASLDFSSNYRTNYAYMLQGYDKSWILNEGSQNSVAYTNLNPGNYVFKVKAINREFTGEPRFSTIPVFIIPAWYQTLGFKILSVIAIGGLLYYFVRLYFLARIRRLKIEYEKMIAVQNERNRISSEIHDDIGAGLSGIRLLAEMTEQKMPDEEIRNEVSKIHSSVSDLSGKMREVIWSLNTDNDKLENLIYYIQRQAHQLFENSSIKLNVTLPEENIPDIELSGETRRHIYLAVKEALHNCLKHSQAYTCKLSMHIRNHSLQIQVHDNGKGIREPSNNFGNGLRNMKKRMTQVAGRMFVENKNGTSIKFDIPLNKNTKA